MTPSAVAVVCLFLAPTPHGHGTGRDWTDQVFGLSPGTYAWAYDAPSDIGAVDFRQDGSFLAFGRRGQGIARWGTWWLSGEKLELRFLSDGENFHSERWEVSMGDLVRPVGKKRSVYSSLKEDYGEGKGIVIGVYAAAVPWRKDRTKSVDMRIDIKPNGTYFTSSRYPDGGRTSGVGRWWLSGRDLQLWLVQLNGKNLNAQTEAGCSEYIVGEAGSSFDWKTGSEEVVRFVHRRQPGGPPTVRAPASLRREGR